MSDLDGLRAILDDVTTRESFDAGRASVIALTLGWQGFVGSHIVDVGDKVQR